MSIRPPVMQTIPEFDQFMNDFVAKLPQAKNIKEEDARVWYNATKEIDPERFLWHAERLKGIGGSDIGEIVAADRGEYNTFKTPFDIINEKLMRKNIEPPTVHTRFGSLMEPVSQQIFQDDFNCTSQVNLIAQINNHTSKRHPWMRSNVDDVVGIGGPQADPQTNGVIVLDYKNKSIIPVEPSTQDKSQVHQYNYALEESGFTGPVGRAIVYTDFKTKKTVPKIVDLDPNILSSLLNAGDKTWEHVLNDSKPAFSVAVKTDLVLPDESKEKLTKLEDQIAKVKIIAESAKNQLDDLQKIFSDELKDQAGDTLVKGQKLPLQLLSTTIRQSINTPELEHLIQSQQLDPEQFQKSGNKFDEEKVSAGLKAVGKDPEQFIEKVWDIDKVLEFCENKGFTPPIQESISACLKATKKNGLSKDELAQIKEQGNELVRSAVGDVSLTADTAPILSPR